MSGKKKSWNIISLQFLWSEMNIRYDISIDYNNYNDDNIDNAMRTIILIKEWKWMLLGHFDFFFACALIIFLGSFFWLFTIFFKRRIGAGREGREGGSIINLKLISTYSISTCYHWMGPFRVSLSTEDWFCSPLWFLNCENNYAFMAIYD